MKRRLFALVVAASAALFVAALASQLVGRRSLVTVVTWTWKPYEYRVDVGGTRLLFTRFYADMGRGIEVPYWFVAGIAIVLPALWWVRRRKESGRARGFSVQPAETDRPGREPGSGRGADR